MPSATVEVLTAQVRTLMVGSRQVTLSVAKQLDFVPLPELQIMGRVKVWPDQLTAIGATDEGVLALAHISEMTAGGFAPVRRADIDPSSVSCCERKRPRSLQWAAFTIEDVSIWMSVEDIRWTRHEPEARAWHTCGPDVHPGARQSKQDAHDAILAAARGSRPSADAIALHQAALQAPLLVLAGLK